MSAIDAVIVEMNELMRENESLKKRLECLEIRAADLAQRIGASEQKAPEPEDETPAGLKSRGWLTTPQEQAPEPAAPSRHRFIPEDREPPRWCRVCGYTAAAHLPSPAPRVDPEKGPSK